jgi:hypothetical protein
MCHARQIPALNFRNKQPIPKAPSLPSGIDGATRKFFTDKRYGALRSSQPPLCLQNGQNDLKAIKMAQRSVMLEILDRVCCEMLVSSFSGAHGCSLFIVLEHFIFLLNFLQTCPQLYQCRLFVTFYHLFPALLVCF